MLKSRIIFVFLATLSFIVAAAITGFTGYLIRTPANFFAALISCGLLIYATANLSKYFRWPVATFALALLMVSMWAETPIKQILQASLSESALDTSPTDKAKFKRTAFFEFSGSYLDFEHAGHHYVEYYGDHHYYAVPVMADIANQQKVRFWAWCRTKNPKNTDQLKRIFNNDLNYGLRVKNATIYRITKMAISNAAIEHRIEIDEDPIILDWGSGKDNRPFLKKLMVMFLSFLTVVVSTVILETVLSSGKRQKKEPNPT